MSYMNITQDIQKLLGWNRYTCTHSHDHSFLASSHLGLFKSLGLKGKFCDTSAGGDG